jgi:hypothetical protein
MANDVGHVASVINTQLLAVVGLVPLGYLAVLLFPDGDPVPVRFLCVVIGLVYLALTAIVVFALTPPVPSP